MLTNWELDLFPQQPSVVQTIYYIHINIWIKTALANKFQVLNFRPVFEIHLLQRESEPECYVILAADV